MPDSTLWATVGPIPLGLAISGDYMYVACSNDGTIKKISLADTSIIETFVENLVDPQFLVINEGYMYVSCSGPNSGNGYIQKINLAAPSQSEILASGLDNPKGIIIDGNYIYVACYRDDAIQQINLSAPYQMTQFASLSFPFDLVINGSFMYVSSLDRDFKNGSIQQINLDTSEVTQWVENLNASIGLTVNGRYLYVADTVIIDEIAGLGTIKQINLNDRSQITYTTINANTLLTGLINYKNNLYVGSASNAIYQIPLTTPPVPPIPSIVCFKEDAQIFTDKGYILVQDLRKGDLIKTIKHGYKPIDLIGRKRIYHPALKERIKDQLYECSQIEYPELFEPLVVTGCHSILVDGFVNEEQKEQVIKVNGNTYVTDNKYRLPACVDPRSSVYEPSGNYMIYHFALENNDEFMNYGIYANGLLVETCSKRYLKELSDMTFIE